MVTGSNSSRHLRLSLLSSRHLRSLQKARTSNRSSPISSPYVGDHWFCARLTSTQARLCCLITTIRMCGGSSQFFRLVLERNRERTKSWWTNCFEMVKRVYYRNYCYNISTERGNPLGLKSHLINTLLITESPSMFSRTLRVALLTAPVTATTVSR